MSLREFRDLAWVPRWSMLRVNRRQSVAEHSYYVALYSGIILDLLSEHMPEIQKLKARVLSYALIHDLDESFLSDIPGPIKRTLIDPDRVKTYVPIALQERFGPQVAQVITNPSNIEKSIIKLADLLDEIGYLAGEEFSGNLNVRSMLIAVQERLPVLISMLADRSVRLVTGYDPSTPDESAHYLDLYTKIKTDLRSLAESIERSEHHHSKVPKEADL